MGDNTNENAQEPAGEAATERRGKRDGKRRRGRRWVLWTGLPLLAVAGVFASRAWAHGGFGGFGCRGHERSRTPEQFEDRLTSMVERVFSHLDASDDQLKAAREIVARNAQGLYAVHAEGRGLRKELMAAAQQNDRDQIEVLRKRGIATMDRGSSLWIANIQELSDVLTPEQRSELFEHLEHFGGRHGPFGHHGEH